MDNNMMLKNASVEDLKSLVLQNPLAISAILGGALGGTAGAVVPTDGNKWKRVRNALLGAAGGAGVGALGSAATAVLSSPMIDESYRRGYVDALNNNSPAAWSELLRRAISK